MEPVNRSGRQSIMHCNGSSSCPIFLSDEDVVAPGPLHVWAGSTYMGDGIFNKGHPDFAIEASGVLPLLFCGGGLAAFPDGDVWAVYCQCGTTFGFMLYVGTGSYA
jgi:hypothetical protein